MSILSEIVIATLGLPAILNKEGRLRARQVIDFPKLIDSKVKSFFAGESTTPETDKQITNNKSGYKNILALITKPTDQSQAEWLMKTLAPIDEQNPQLVTDTGADILRILHYVDSQLPRNITNSIAGPEINKPSGAELARFQRLWNVAISPLSILDNLINISSDEAATLEQLYPEIYNRIKQVLVEIAIRRKASGKDITREQEKAIERFSDPLGISAGPISPDISSGIAVQASFEQKKQNPSGSSKSAAAGSKLSKNLQTPGQSDDSSNLGNS